jgi:hypothetical protein
MKRLIWMVPFALVLATGCGNDDEKTINWCENFCERMGDCREFVDEWQGMSREQVVLGCQLQYNGCGDPAGTPTFCCAKYDECAAFAGCTVAGTECP